MANLILLGLCLIIGILLQRAKAFPSNTHQVLNQFIIYISLPAMALYYIPKIELSLNLLYPILMPWLSIAIAFVLFSLLGKWLGWSKALIGCLIMTAGFGNTSFVGIPIIQAIYGNEGLKTLMLIDLPGTFIALSTVGIIIATMYSRGQTTWQTLTKKVLSFPPFIVFLLALILNIFGLSIPLELDQVLEKLSLTITPLALVSVGYQLKINKHSKHWKFLILGLSYQLIFFPAFIYVLYKYILQLNGMMIDVTIMEAAMAPMITACIVAAQYGLKPKLCAMMIGIGIPVSFLTLTVWHYILQG